MSWKRIGAVVGVIVAFVATGAIAIAQNVDRGGDDQRIESTDPANGYPDSLNRAIAQDLKDAPPGTKPGPTIGPDEVHVPEGPPAKFFVEHCDTIIDEDPDALEKEPLCRVVKLMEADELAPGIYREEQIKQEFDRVFVGTAK